MAWSNIFLQLITMTGPIIGEGLLDGWETSIELEKFSWDVTVKEKTQQVSTGGVLGALKSAAKGGLLGIGGNNLDMGVLSMTKRFDIASSMIHTCIDNDIRILSASITVLNIKQGGRAIHEPGFTLVATDGYFRDVQLDMAPTSGNAVEVKETITMEFNAIVVSYLKRVGKDNIPTNPFFYKAA
jgi:type VI protein secretion system component Hcp